MIRSMQPTVIGILEPKQRASKIEKLARKIGYEHYMHGDPINSHIWIFWKRSVRINHIVTTDQTITMRVTINDDMHIQISMVYAKCTRRERLTLWEDLKAVSDTTEPWIVGGDFNIILHTEEKKGGRGYDILGMQDFRDCLMEAQLSDVGLEGNRYTWCNHQQGRTRVWERLDRFLGNGEAFLQLPALKCSHLARVASDHSPIFLTVAPSVTRKSRFIFQQMWMEHPEFKTVVQQVWSEPIVGSASYVVSEKLRRLQQKLKKWNWETFGDIRKRIGELKIKIERLEVETQQRCIENHLESLRQAKEELTQVLRWEADLLRQKTREKFITDGDRNTSFFHALIKDRRKRNTIKITRQNGEVISDNQELLEGAVTYFRELFSASQYHMAGALFDDYTPVVTERMNQELEAIPSNHEILDSIKGLSPDSAPGLDGFTGHFFRGCWDIVQNDVVNMVQGYFLGDHLHSRVKNTMLILIPKVESPQSYNDFRPISLSSFVSKIITKILANRLSIILPQVIDEEQYGFVKGRQIHESIALAQEMVRDIDRDIEGGNVILKLDMTKAYDRIEWRFLIRALRVMGFSAGVQDLVYRSVGDIQYTVCINGENSTKFRSTRGVRQGDPLSPLLFIVAQQIFTYNLKRMEYKGDIQPYQLSRQVQAVSHLLFADDMLIFSNGRVRSLRRMRNLIQNYEYSSGQKINLDKSSMFVSKHITGRKLTQIQEIFGCPIKTFPFTYLGAPIFKGRGKEEYFERIIRVISNKLEGWKAKFISFAGKITLLKAVLASIPVHTLSCTVVPKSVIHKIESLMKSFLWSQHGQKRTHWVEWDEVCRPYKEDGLDIRSLEATIFGLHGKLAWKVFSGNSLWCRLLRQKYGAGAQSNIVSRNQSASILWKKLFPHFHRCREIGEWCVGRGRISFWHDNWLGSILDETNSSSLTVQEGLRELDKWRPALTNEQLEKAQRVVINNQADDELWCNLNATGKFRVADYIDRYRSRRSELKWTDFVWNKITPYRMNCFMWKVMRGAISVDANIQKKGISIASQCVCCNNPKIESLNHLLVTSDMAQEVWQHFAIKLQKQGRMTTVKNLLQRWLQGVSFRTQLGATTIIIIFSGMWEIWKARCAAKFGDEKRSDNALLRKIYNNIHEIGATFRTKRSPTTLDRILLEGMRCRVHEPQIRQGRWIQWQKPLQYQYKLNVDGACKAGIGGGGGVLRDCNGEFIWGFSTVYGRNVEVIWIELQALFDGISRCVNRGVHQVWIETDASIIPELLQGVSSQQWKYEYQVRKISPLLNHINGVNFVFREQNKVADQLSKMAVDSQMTREFFSVQEVPRTIQKIIFVDRIGIPTFRSPCN